jgi:hypothetical protein
LTIHLTRRINKSNKIQEKLSINFIFTTNHNFQTPLSGRPGPRPGFWVLTGSPGRPSQNFFKSKRRRFSKKNKSQQVVTGYCRFIGSHWVFPYPIFSSTRLGFNPRSAESRFDPPGRAEFQNYATNDFRKYINIMKKLFFPTMIYNFILVNCYNSQSISTCYLWSLKFLFFN